MCPLASSQLLQEDQASDRLELRCAQEMTSQVAGHGPEILTPHPILSCICHLPTSALVDPPGTWLPPRHSEHHTFRASQFSLSKCQCVVWMVHRRDRKDSTVDGAPHRTQQWTALWKLVSLSSGCCHPLPPSLLLQGPSSTSVTHHGVFCLPSEPLQGPPFHLSSFSAR